LSALWKFRIQIAKLDVDLDCSASAIGVKIEEPLLQDVEKDVDLAFGILAAFAVLFFA
jgi:hypothetical protein